MSTIEEIEDLLHLLQKRKTELDRKQGELDAFLKELKKTYKTDNLKELDKIKDTMSIDITNKKNELQIELQEFYAEIEKHGIQ